MSRASPLPVPEVVRALSGPVKSARRERVRVRAAPFWRRTLASLIDISLLLGGGAAVIVAGVVPAPALPPRGHDWLELIVDLLANAGSRLLPFAMALSIAGLLYGTLLHVLVQRTFGELLLGLRLISTNGQRVGLIRAVAHSLGTIVGLAGLLLGMMWAAVDRRRQTLAEYVSGTLLIVGRPLGP